MKHSWPIIFFVILLACNQSGEKSTEIRDSVAIVSNDSPAKNNIPASPQTPSTQPGNDRPRTDTFPLSASDSVLLGVAEKILAAIKAKDYPKLSSYVHPTMGVRFTSYTNVDTTDDAVLSSKQLTNPATLSKYVMWRAFESGDSSGKMTVRDYLSKFVYDVDFLRAPLKSVNHFHHAGTDINNVREAYPGADVVEFHFPGFDPKYEGLDFRTLRLVLKTIDKKPWLIGIIHSNWTP